MSGISAAPNSSADSHKEEKPYITRLKKSSVHITCGEGMIDLISSTTSSGSSKDDSGRAQSDEEDQGASRTVNSCNIYFIDPMNCIEISTVTAKLSVFFLSRSALLRNWFRDNGILSL